MFNNPQDETPDPLNVSNVNISKDTITFLELMIGEYFKKNAALSHQIDEEINQNLAVLKLQMAMASQQTGTSASSVELLSNTMSQLSVIMAHLRLISENISSIDLNNTDFLSTLNKITSYHTFRTSTPIQTESLNGLDQTSPSNCLMINLVINLFLDILAQMSSLIHINFESSSPIAYLVIEGYIKRKFTGIGKFPAEDKERLVRLANWLALTGGKLEWISGRKYLKAYQLKIPYLT
jgi:hypothetical protein